MKADQMVPGQILFEKRALDFEYGRELFKKFNKIGISVAMKTNLKNSDSAESCANAFAKGKQTLIIGTRSVGKFEPCRPSADFQLPVVTGCPGMCEYCYLMTRTGTKPYSKLNVNLQPVLELIEKYAEEKFPQETKFELSASSDPMAYEPLTGIVSKMILHFSKLETARLRICTKFDSVDTLQGLTHNGRTEIRFSVNAEEIIKKYEHGTPPLSDRLTAAKKLLQAGYGIGIMIAPVFIFDGWESAYRRMLETVNSILKNSDIRFEIVTHRYTEKALRSIEELFPDSDIRDSLNPDFRQFKFGQFGYGKYLYQKAQMEKIKYFFNDSIQSLFGENKIIYIV